MGTMADQALEGLDLMVSHNGIMRVRDGEDTWLCHETAWDAAVSELESRKPLAGDEGGAEAYTRLCSSVRGPVASINGSSHGDWQSLVQEAFAAELIDSDDARAYGVEVEL